MKILAIETSCDDTGIAVLEVANPPSRKASAKQAGSFKVLSNVVASQIEVHKQYGGVYPFMAKREHEKNLAPTLKTSLEQANISLENIDLIAVTNGPGLEPCLWVGVNFAKDLSKKYNIPLVPINHIEGHILVNFLENKDIKFPAIALVVSGGHTQIILMKKIGSYEILGETRDDAAGECFDKCAKILGLGYPGGPEIAKLALQFKSQSPKTNTQTKLPRPMINTKDYDFSFSGLKTAVLYADRKILDKNKKYKEEMSAEVQQAIIDVLIKKTIKAVKDFKAKTIILGGGVSANQELRKQFAKSLKNNHSDFLPYGKKSLQINLVFPETNLSTDNGLMIALAGYFHYNKKVAPLKVATIKANSNLRL